MIIKTPAASALPFALGSLAGIAFQQNILPPDNLLSSFSCGFLILGLLLAWWFNRSRVFFLLLLLGISQFGLLELLKPGSDTIFLQQTLAPLIALLLPLNFLILSRLQERGIFSLWGLLPLGAIILQVFFAVLIVLTRDVDLVIPLGTPLLPTVFSGLTAFTPIPQSALLFFLASGTYFLIRLRQPHSHLDLALLPALLTLLPALHYRESPSAVPVFFAAAALILLAAVIQDSYAMAYRDELTGIPARRALQETLMQLSGHYTLAMVDIDHFKKFNDTYGHDVGDEVLRLVASVLATVGGGGKAFRYGGEEFTVVFPGKNLTAALPHLEALREQIAKTGYAPKPKAARKRAAKPLFVTISIGACEKNSRHPEVQAVLKDADKALYRAKEKGRNCVSK